MTLFPESSGAIFSDCMRYRYRLWRKWDERKGYAAFLMLNPSTADETQLDPTCTRAQKYAMNWGYGGLEVINLFAWRSTDPQGMLSADDPVGPDNDRAIIQVASQAGIVICAWGEHGTHQDRAGQVVGMLRNRQIRLHALSVNKGGQPGHPLYLPGNLEPKEWE